MPIRPPQQQNIPAALKKQEEHQRARRVDRRRGSAKARGYTSAWARASKTNLINNPLCAYCKLDGRTTPATLTDHLYPHRRDMALFWAKIFWVSSCQPCHSQWKQRLEHRGEAAIDAIALRLGRPTLSEWRGSGAD